MEKKTWGTLSTGEKVTRYTIRNASGSWFVTMDYGADLLELHVPDRDGALADVVLGFRDLEAYRINDPCFGCTVSPYANRIGGASFTLNGRTYALDRNDHDHNTLHSGLHPLHHRIWNVTDVSEDSITYRIRKSDGECGFPGNVDLSVTYTLSEDNTLSIHYHALSDQDTVLNPTNHSYFNLSGQDSGSALGEIVTIDADSYTDTDEEQVPHGALVPVEGTPMDLRKPTVLRDALKSKDSYPALKIGNGFDHNFVLSTSFGHPKKVAALYDPKSGRLMEISTDMPGIQLYTGNYLAPEPVGKNGTAYAPGSGVAFETQFYPNAVNVASFPQPLLKAGEAFDSKTSYHFSVK